MTSLDHRLALSLARGINALYTGTISPTIVSALTDTQVFMEAVGSRRFTILFPGTASMRDLITDLMFRKTKWWADQFAHRGFVAAFESVVEPLREQLSGAKSVIIAGPSLGGALATLCASRVRMAGIPVTGVYTFGSPRVGNGNFAKEYDAHLAGVTFRYWNAGDPVPCVPPPLPVPTGIYTHVGTEIYLQDGGASQNPWWMVHAAEILKSIRHPLRTLESLDHPIKSYIAKLEALA